MTTTPTYLWKLTGGQMARIMSQIPLWTWYALIAVGVVLSYQGAKEAMIRQDAWVLTVRSPITLNSILLLFMWGMIADKVTKGKSRRTGWVIWGIGLAVLILVFRFVGGAVTIFG